MLDHLSEAQFLSDMADHWEAAARDTESALTCSREVLGLVGRYREEVKQLGWEFVAACSV